MKRTVTLIVMLVTLVCFGGCNKHEIPTGKPQEQPVDKPEEKPEPKETSISILAIGNSFSVDAMHYLYGFLKEAGYEKVYLGNLYIGSCSLKTHAGHFTANDKAYTYYVNESGSWVTKNNFSPIDALESTEWDYISMQQASADSGMPDTYDPYLGQLIDIVTKNCPKAELMWHMTWAYQSNSSHASFPKYDKDQMKMYESIVNTVKAKITPVKAFVHIIPSGTAVQNLRTSFIGDNITRDGHHMSYNIGRYVTALMWARQIAGIDVENTSYRPADQTYTDHQIQAMKDAVEKAFQKPFEVTESAYKESTGGDDVPEYEYPEYKANTALRKMVTDAGYDLTDYKELEYGYHAYSYYNSSKSSMLEARSSGSTASNIDQFGSIGIYERKDLPVGTIIACEGRVYRPEGWVSLNSTNSSRPGTTSERIVMVDNGWWGSYNYRAFNISWEGNIHMSEAQMNAIPEGFAIFVPTKEITVQEPKTADEMLMSKGYDLSKYERMSISLTASSYYNSSNSSYKSTLISKANSTATNLDQYSATPIYEKKDIPVGSVIVIMPGYQYRPEGWTALDTVNKSGDRPANVTDAVTEVTTSWWGSWNYRAFNVAKVGTPNLSVDEQAALKDVFAIYRPIIAN